jgi:hypothetical protein
MELLTEVYLYPTAKGSIQRIYRPIGFIRKNTGELGHELIFDVGQPPLLPGGRRRIPCRFTHEASLDAVNSAGRFYIWDGGFVGEADIVGDHS